MVVFVYHINMEKELLKNIKTFWSSAELVYKTEDYTSATILYFKCFFVALDYLLLKRTGKTPKDHTERFRMLEKDLPEIYKVLDKYFPLYRDTYSLNIEKYKCDEVKKHVADCIKKQGIETEGKGIF